MIRFDTWAAIFLILGAFCLFAAWVTTGLLKYVNAAAGAGCILFLITHMATTARTSRKKERAANAKNCRMRAGKYCLLNYKECNPDTCNQI